MPNQFTTSRDITVRFWSKVAITADNEKCWEWQAGRFTKRFGISGYGLFSIKSKAFLAHRIAWQLTNGMIPDGLQVLHSCDNPGCVNPKHLFLGTQLENMKDRNSKNRQARLSGEKSGSHKLTTEQIEYIRSSYANGKTSPMLAAEMGIHRTHVWRIVKRINWSE